MISSFLLPGGRKSFWKKWRKISHYFLPSVFRFFRLQPYCFSSYLLSFHSSSLLPSWSFLPTSLCLLPWELPDRSWGAGCLNWSMKGFNKHPSVCQSPDESTGSGGETRTMKIRSGELISLYAKGLCEYWFSAFYETPNTRLSPLPAMAHRVLTYVVT